MLLCISFFSFYLKLHCIFNFLHVIVFRTRLPGTNEPKVSLVLLFACIDAKVFLLPCSCPIRDTLYIKELSAMTCRWELKIDQLWETENPKWLTPCDSGLNQNPAPQPCPWQFLRFRTEQSCPWPCIQRLLLMLKGNWSQTHIPKMMLIYLLDSEPPSPEKMRQRWPRIEFCTDAATSPCPSEWKVLEAKRISDTPLPFCPSSADQPRLSSQASKKSSSPHSAPFKRHHPLRFPRGGSKKGETLVGPCIPESTRHCSHTSSNTDEMSVPSTSLPFQEIQLHLETISPVCVSILPGSVPLAWPEPAPPHAKPGFTYVKTTSIKIMGFFFQISFTVFEVSREKILKLQNNYLD